MPSTLNIFLIRKVNKLSHLLSKFVLLLAMISIYVPFSPKMPAPDLDSSWSLGLNQAVAQGLAFGKEIIFTLGPYSSVYTKAYHPATDLMMIISSTYLAISYWMALLFLVRNRHWVYWIFPFCGIFLGMIYARDSLMFSYPLLAGIVSYQLLLIEKNINANSYLILSLVILLAPFGLLFLVKGSLLILCLLVTCFCFVFFIANNRKQLAITCLVSPIMSTLLFWVAAKQSLIYLPNYFISSCRIAFGFTEAMSTIGNTKEIILYLVSSVSIFIFIIWQKKILGISKFFLLSLFFVFLFISFKAGFTRHMGHVFIPGTSLLLATLFLSCVFNSRVIYLLIFTSLISWYYINSHYTTISLQNNFKSIYSSAWHGLKNRILNPYWLEENFTFILNYINIQAAFPKLYGTTDIYSYNQSFLISSQNKWAPRPIFQSYSVFIPSLAKNNKEHLQGKYSPNNIIFKIEPIDNRIPSLEDGVSWPLLLENYQPTKMHNGFLFLKRNTSHHNKSKLITLLNEKHVLGEQVNVPPQHQILFATLEMKLTVWGVVTTIFYKPSQLHIILFMQDGTEKKYRLIASMAKSSFLLSPLIENTTDFSFLYKKNNALSEKKVQSFIITSKHNHNWKPIYYIKFQKPEINYTI